MLPVLHRVSYSENKGESKISVIPVSNMVAKLCAKHRVALVITIQSRLSALVLLSCHTYHAMGNIQGPLLTQRSRNKKRQRPHHHGP